MLFNSKAETGRGARRRRSSPLHRPSLVPTTPIVVATIEEVLPGHPVIDLLAALYGRRGAPARIAGAQQ